MAWLGTWAKRISLTLDYTNKIAGSVTQFPVSVFLQSSNGQTSNIFTEVGANLQKIALTQEDGTTQLYSEIEQWDSNGTAVVHCSLSGWTISADTTLYIYYDNAQPNNTTYIGTTKAATPVSNVWDTNYLYVHHADEADATNLADSTIYAHNILDTGSVTQTVGKVRAGRLLDGTNDFYVRTNGTMAIANVFTIENLFNPSSTADQRCLWSHRADGGGDSTSMIRTYFTTLNKIKNELWDSAQANFKDYNTGSTYSTSTWYHYATTWDGTTFNLYTNGAIETPNKVLDNAGTMTDSNRTFQLGADQWDLTKWTGMMDEHRISNAARSAAWIKGTYNTLFDTLLTYGNEEALPGGATVDTNNSISFGTNF